MLKHKFWLFVGVAIFANVNETAVTTVTAGLPLWAATIYTGGHTW